MLCKDIHDTRDILRGELVVIRRLHALGRSVDEECAVILVLLLLHHHDAGRDRSAEEQIARQLDDAVHDSCYQLSTYGFSALHLHGT